MRHHDFTYAKRALWRYFEATGYERTEPRMDGDHFFAGSLLRHSFPSTEDRLEAWLNDSFLFTIEHLEQGSPQDLIYAFRGFCQVCEYRAQVPSRGGPSLADLYLILRNYFEETFQGLIRERDEALAVMQDALEQAQQLGPYRGRR